MSKFRAIVLGGARSGKSALAERLAVHTGKTKVYVATGQAFDEEMQTRIAAHQARRQAGWRTVEAPLEAARALRAGVAGEILLLDCATLWLSNQMLAGGDVATACDDLMAALQYCPADVIVVSNETGLGIVPDTPLGRRFRDAQGALNQRLATSADLAVLTVAGLPLVLKGALPEGFA